MIFRRKICPLLREFFPFEDSFSLELITASRHASASNNGGDYDTEKECSATR